MVLSARRYAHVTGHLGVSISFANGDTYFQGVCTGKNTYIILFFAFKESLPGPNYFDEEAKCYGRLFEFCQVTFCHSRQ